MPHLLILTDRDPFDDETNSPKLGIPLRIDEHAWRSQLQQIKDVVEKQAGIVG